jgi:RHS repeat-associated protein
MDWNYKDELVAVSRQQGANPEITYYQYDSQGRRLRKVTEYQGSGPPPGQKDQRIYLEGYEYYENFNSGEQIHSLSLKDERQRFVMVEKTNIPGHHLLVRYLHDSHQGSCTLETDESGNVITYEEYHPFGTSSYQATNAGILSSSKRYRYTCMERDDETGLSYHNARYYIPWLGRWLSPDPIGIEDGVNVYAYCRNNPVGNTDKEGTQIDEKTPQEDNSQPQPSSDDTGWPKLPEQNSPYQKIVPDGVVDSTIYINTSGVKFAPEEFMEGGGLEVYENELRRQLDINGFDFVKIKFVTSLDDLKISPTDQIVNLKYDEWNNNKQGETEYFPKDPYNTSFTSRVNVAKFTFPAVYNGFPSVENYKVISSPREFANTTAHEIFHGFLIRATAFYGMTDQKLGSDTEGHFNSTKNIMNSGDQRARNGSLTLDDRINKNKILEVEKLPGKVNSIIKSWMNKENVFVLPPLKPIMRVIK